MHLGIVLQAGSMRWWMETKPIRKRTLFSFAYGIETRGEKCNIEWGPIKFLRKNNCIGFLSISTVARLTQTKFIRQSVAFQVSSEVVRCTQFWNVFTSQHLSSNVQSRWKKGMERSQDRSKRGALHRTQRDTNGAKSIDDNDGYEVLFMASIY